MRDQTRRRLEWLIWRRRLLNVAGGFAVAAVAAIGFWWEGLDAQVENRRVAGTVEAIEPLTTRDAALGVLVEVALADGRHARVQVAREHEPHVGDHVEISEQHHRSGRVTFSWRSPGTAAP